MKSEGDVYDFNLQLSFCSRENAVKHAFANFNVEIKSTAILSFFVQTMATVAIACKPWFVSTRNMFKISQLTHAHFIFTVNIVHLHIAIQKQQLI